MIETDFWNLIASSKSNCQGELENQVEWLRRELQERPETEILDFDRLLHEQMRLSYSRDLWAAAYIINGGCSDDGFDCFRAWLIAQGHEIFHDALNDPETLADVAEADVELELLLYVAVKAYETRTNRKFPYPTYPKAELVGPEWDEDEEALKEKYPKLFAKFWATDAREDTGVPGAELSRAIGALLMMVASPEHLAKAAALLTRAADHDDANAQYILGTCYQEGRGVAQDYLEAAKRYRQAAEQGHADGCGGLGALYHEGLGVTQDHEEALRWYRKGAAGGSHNSEFGLGVLYSGGLGVAQDLQQSLQCFRRAAQSGNERAALNVGLILLNGKGVAANATEAFKWFVLAADSGSIQARYNLGVLYEQGRGVERDYAKAAQMYQAAADAGSDKAMLNLGMLYFNGKGVAQDYAQAAALYRQSMEAGNLTAASNLAVLYQHGRGVAQDQVEAARLYRLSAEAGIAIGQFNLGTMYGRGIGVPKDDQEALRWYHLAAAQNYAGAMNNIADAYENGRGVAQDYAEAAKWYRQAAEAGVSASQYSLGKFYRDGLGVQQDYQEAAKWLTRAVENGYEKAKPILEALYEEGRVARPQPALTQPEVGQAVIAAEPQSAANQKIVPPQMAAQRALCLRALFRRSQIEFMLAATRQNPQQSQASNPGALAAEALSINGWLKDEELWAAASDNEKVLLTLPPGSWPEKARIGASWRAEALGVIGWALGLEDRIFPFDTQLNESSFVYSMTILSPTKEFVSNAKLRDEKEILRAREIAENWLWRARTTQIQKELDKYPPPAGYTYEKIISMAAEHWEKEGLFTPVRGDYPARGKAYSELTEKEWQELRSIANERLYGLNWLCKHAANWDSVPTET